jgi:hypothetical protein
MIDPPRWSSDEFERDRMEAIKIFRRERLEEPLEAYLELFDRYQGVFEELLEATVDLSALRQHGVNVLTDDRLFEALRYIAGPFISADDLKTVAEISAFNKNALRNDPALTARIVDLILLALDRRRFPWVSENREPSEAEKLAAVIASAGLIATQRLGTARRHQGKKAQEQQVEDALLKRGFTKVPTRPVLASAQGPGVGEFCGESMFGTRKADFIVRLWDQRLMPLECKVSNSALNSVKRLNNDAAAKATAWLVDFGTTQIVPAAVITGVYKLTKLQDAQQRGLTIFWAYKLPAMLDWIDSTKSPSP